MAKSSAKPVAPAPTVSSPVANPLAELPGYALRRAASVMMAELSERLATVDLRISEATVLLLVGERRDLPSSDIGRILYIQRPHMVPVLARL